MEKPSIEQALERARRAVDSGSGLDGTGFWDAVAKVKTNPELADRYGDRIADIDEMAFHNRALLVVPLGLGTVLAWVMTIAGVVLIGWAYSLEGAAAVVTFYVGLGILLVSTHGLGHWVAGRITGIRFLAWYVGSLTRPQPGIKVDYQSYLRAPATARAWMHASGALVTKLVPVSLIGAAVAANLPAWAVWGVAGIAVAAIATDLIWSTKSSDWMRFRREMRFAQSGW